MEPVAAIRFTGYQMVTCMASQLVTRLSCCVPAVCPLRTLREFLQAPTLAIRLRTSPSWPAPLSFNKSTRAPRRRQTFSAKGGDLAGSPQLHALLNHRARESKASLGKARSFAEESPVLCGRAPAWKPGPSAISQCVPARRGQDRWESPVLRGRKPGPLRKASPFLSTDGPPREPGPSRKPGPLRKAGRASKADALLQPRSFAEVAISIRGNRPGRSRKFARSFPERSPVLPGSDPVVRGSLPGPSQKEARSFEEGPFTEVPQFQEVRTWLPVLWDLR